MKKKKEKKNLHISSSHFRADQAPDPPWGDRLIHTDQINVTDPQDSGNPGNARDDCALVACAAGAGAAGA